MRATLRPLMIFALIGTAAAVPAFAQSSGSSGAPSTYPACATKPTQADTDAAHGAYMAGKGSFDEADYTTAVNYFKDAYRRDCTKHELLVIIARAFELQGNRREAIHALETYLDRVPTAQDIEVQKRHIANLKRELADQPSASAVAPPPSASASASAAPSASTLVVPPVPSASPGGAPSSESAVASSGSGHSIVPWFLVIGGGVAAVAGGVLFGVGTGQVSSGEQTCPTHQGCSATAASQGNSGRTNETVGVGVGAAGLAIAAGGLLWHFLEPTGGPPKTGRPVVTPQAAPGYAGVGVRATF